MVFERNVTRLTQIARSQVVTDFAVLHPIGTAVIAHHYLNTPTNHFFTRLTSLPITQGLTVKINVEGVKESLYAWQVKPITEYPKASQSVMQTIEGFTANPIESIQYVKDDLLSVWIEGCLAIGNTDCQFIEWHKNGAKVIYAVRLQRNRKRLVFIKRN